MIKKISLVLLLLTLFMSASNCKKPLPTSPDIMSVVSPPKESQAVEGRAILEIFIIPGKGLFADNPEYPVFAMQFTIVATEKNNVGGRIDIFLVEGWEGENLLHSEIFQGATFKPLGVVSRYVLLIIVGQPDEIVIWTKGVDDNGHNILLMFSFNV